MCPYTSSRWQILPDKLEISGHDTLLEETLELVAEDLGTDVEYDIEASLYKFLLYEEGCFFARHRDNERLCGMFGTLVIQLPSAYEGGKLTVHSPLETGWVTSFPSYNGMQVAAFYADCYHEVSELTKGHRSALVYQLTARKKASRPVPHLPAAPPVPSQPVGDSVALRLAKLVNTFDLEADEDYPKTWTDEVYYDRGGQKWPGKPKKLAIVLSHHYTPVSLTGREALKGTDRSLAELIRAAATINPAEDIVPPLSTLAAKYLLNFGGEQFAGSPELKHIHDMIFENFLVDDEGPFFDAAISLAHLGDYSDFVPTVDEFERDNTTNFVTTGPLIPLTGGNEMPFDLGPKLPNDTEADYHPSWYHDDERCYSDGQFTGPFPWALRQEKKMDDVEGNHSLPIYSHELLFASENAAAEYREDSTRFMGKHVLTDPSYGLSRGGAKKVEFLGNGGVIYSGRVYSRAVILTWPRSNRNDVQRQSRGGRDVLASQSSDVARASGNAVTAPGKYYDQQCK